MANSITFKLNLRQFIILERLDPVTDPPDTERLFQIQPVQKVLDPDIQNWVGDGIVQLNFVSMESVRIFE
jgi:hypothetical protein